MRARLRCFAVRGKKSKFVHLEKKKTIPYRDFPLIFEIMYEDAVAILDFMTLRRSCYIGLHDMHKVVVYH